MPSDVEPGTRPGAEPDCAAPPAHPTAPRHRLPAGACDTHLHVFGPPSRYPLDTRRNYTPHVCTLADYRRVMTALGVERAVLVQPSVYGEDNRALLDALREGGANFRGVVVPPADVGDGDLAAMHTLGVRGIRLNLVNPAVLSVDASVSLCERIEARGWHLQLQLVLDRARMPVLDALLRRTRLPLVIDHLGRVPPEGEIGPLLDALDTGRVWIKLSAPYRSSRRPPPYGDLAERIAALGATRADRLLWGSDWPHTEQPARTPESGMLADLLSVWLPDEATRRQVLVDNPARLYGFA